MRNIKGFQWRRRPPPAAPAYVRDVSRSLDFTASQIELAAKMKLSLIFVVAASVFGLTNAREFSDDRGVVYSWPDDGSVPKIVVNAEGGLSLFNLGRLLLGEQY